MINTMNSRRLWVLALACLATAIMAVHMFMFVPVPSYLEIILVVSSAGVCVVLLLEALSWNNNVTAKTGLYLFLGVCLCLTLLFGGATLTATSEQLHHIAALIEQDEAFRRFFNERYGHRGMLSMLDAWRLQAFAAHDTNAWPKAVEAFVDAKNMFKGT